jgi:hypothetical protein
MARIFISYRRRDAERYVARLAEAVATEHGWQVSMDWQLEPGVGFPAAVEAELASADVVLAVIGDRWAGSEPDARLRLDESEDLVRRELEIALQRGDVPVVPVLVGGARLPAEEDLPASLQGLVRRNAIELTDQAWRSDLERLVAAVSRISRTGVESMPAPASTRPPGPPVGDDNPWWRRPFRRGRPGAGP